MQNESQQYTHTHKKQTEQPSMRTFQFSVVIDAAVWVTDITKDTHTHTEMQRPHLSHRIAVGLFILCSVLCAVLFASRLLLRTRKHYGQTVERVRTIVRSNLFFLRLQQPPLAVHSSEYDGVCGSTSIHITFGGGCCACNARFSPGRSHSPGGGGSAAVLCRSVRSVLRAEVRGAAVVVAGGGQCECDCLAFDQTETASAVHKRSRTNALDVYVCVFSPTNPRKRGWQRKKNNRDLHLVHVNGHKRSHTRCLPDYGYVCTCGPELSAWSTSRTAAAAAAQTPSPPNNIVQLRVNHIRFGIRSFVRSFRSPCQAPRHIHTCTIRITTTATATADSHNDNGSDTGNGRRIDTRRPLQVEITTKDYERTNLYGCSTTKYV